MSQEELTEIYIHLKDVLNRLTQTSVNEEFSDDQILKDMLILKKILENKVIDEQSRTLLSLINEVSESISNILNLRFNLKTRCNSNAREPVSIEESSFLHNDLSTDNTLINSISVDEIPIMLHEDNISKKVDQKIHKDNLEFSDTNTSFNHGRRLPKNIIFALEEWYNENIDNPYLTKDDIHFLKSETNLEDSQIKNWVSNKRRKRKETKISPELSYILNNGNIN